MRNLIKIDPIAVKDKKDVVEALTILEKLGIKIMTEEQKKNYLADKTKKVDNNFMIQEDDGGFRIQSHYIGFGISLQSLGEQIETILKKYPNISEKINDILEREEKLKKEIERKTSNFNSSFSCIEIKEK